MISQDEKAAIRRICEDLPDDELVRRAAEADEEAKDARERRIVITDVLFARMQETNASLIPGPEDCDYNATLSAVPYYEASQENLQAAWDLIEATGENPGKYLANERNYQFRTTRAAEALIRELEAKGWRWQEYLEPVGGLAMKNGRNLMLYLGKLGTRASHIHIERKHRRANGVSLVRKANVDEGQA